MSAIRQVILGVLAALLSSAIVIGSLTISLFEGGARLAQVPGQVAAQEGSPVPPLPAEVTLLPGELAFTASPSPLATAQINLPTATLVCDHPSDWVQIVTQVGDTLAGLAQGYGSTEQDLMRYNCLVGRTLAPASFLYVPAPPTASPTAVPPTESPPPAQNTPVEAQPKCGPPSRWVLYTIQPGDTLFGISLATGASVSSLQSANCLGGSTTIRSGQQLWVPVLPAPRLPFFSPTPRPSATSQPTITQPPATPAPPDTAEPPPPTTPPEPPTSVPETPLITTEPPTEPPAVTTEPPPVTTELPPLATDPPVVVTEPPAPATEIPTLAPEPSSPTP